MEAPMPELKPGLLGNDHDLVLNPVTAILPPRVALAPTIEPNRHGILSGPLGFISFERNHVMTPETRRPAPRCMKSQ